jgi:hypothetical protein
MSRDRLRQTITVSTAKMITYLRNMGTPAVKQVIPTGLQL